jgi:hypothetical protein
MEQTTRQATPRSTRPDALTDDAAHLVKSCDLLRLTYQIRLLTFMAHQRGIRLRIHVGPSTMLSGTLDAFVREHGAVVSVERMG